jgi:hypothetical protein
MPSANSYAHRLIDEIAPALGAPVLDVDANGPGEAADLETSGVAALTGPPDGPPIPVPGFAATLTRAALAVAAAYLRADLPGVEVLGDRARLSGLRRNAPWSAGGAFRTLRALDGWFGLSLSRPSDLELLPALVEGRVDDPWTDVGKWLAGQTTSEIAERVAMLGLAGSAVTRGPLHQRRPPVAVHPGDARRPRRRRPRVVDLTALWAGPLCARLLGLAGAHIVKIESKDRPDGARFGSREFFEHLHEGHESVVLDFERDRTGLLELIGSADVVLESSRPRALRQLGIDAHDHVNRGTIWVGITAYGRDEANEHRIGFGDDVAAGAGLVADLDGVPVPVGDAIADPLAGVHAAAAAAIALTSDRGTLLDVSMHDAARRAISTISARPGTALW